MKTIDKLLKVVPPPRTPKNAGSLAAWRLVQQRVSLPDWLFAFFHAYGSGEFAVYDGAGAVADSITLLNVFEKPLLESHMLDGQGFTEETKSTKYPRDFFPEACDGLFPITRSDQGKFLLFDPRNEERVCVTASFLTFFHEFNLNLIDFLCL